MIAEQLGIAQLAFLGKGMDRPEGLPSSVAAAVFEAIIGAIYLDGGLDAARDFILRSVRPFVTKVLADQHPRNYKSILQQYAQSHWGRSPEYQVLDEKGPDHSKCFEVAVAINGRIFPSAWGKNKKEAEQEAARRALAEMGMPEISQ
jgi:ribonuclease-3